MSHILANMPNIDLTRVVYRVKRDHPDWTETQIEEVEAAYRCFLQLCKTFPERKIAAPPNVDVVWHMHMLDSVAYMRDCDVYFGHYLHHDPCIGEADIDGANDTLVLYEETFGTTPPSIWMGLTTCANPGEGCGSIHA
ncbi:hypothetical protein A3B32_02945 [Candidatus Uhrbacteria bacterium RIFCSPLOWO2_01_FULL_53_9]|uniref:Glycine-rich domain-containing protein-like n=2 Tax=Candidatus Uhriibacteriota TaxID=1752732 RepID=A0A1F7UYM5_9BACT|nr:MAG: hypothetical protein A3C17_04280 [Candidatus Uhrbacteria bacterium RIFCSPHIGHO2_02_FULL_53_13]OGL83360.1 MAG: hypothetical protein A3B32_02945 [Candidatus Uhrbacteria bacterium RIFCSPLOWO2_01_FULL_53_9]